MTNILLGSCLLLAFASWACLAVSTRLRGPARILLHRLGVFVGGPATAGSLVLLPLEFELTLADGLALAGLFIALVTVMGVGFSGRGGKRVRIGVVIPSRAPFHTDLRRGLSDGLSDARYNIYDDYLVNNHAVENLSDFFPALQRALRWRADYIVVCPPTVGLASAPDVVNLLTSFLRRGGGVVFIDNPPDLEVRNRLGGRQGSVTSDVVAGATWIAKYVLDRTKPGQRVLVLQGPGSSAPGLRKREAFERLLPDAQVEVADSGGWTEESTYRLTTRALKASRPLRFVVCGNDVMAIGAVRAIRESESIRKTRGSSLTQVIGYDGIPRALFAISEPSNPLCATIRTPPSAYGHEIARMIREEVEGVFPRRRLRDACLPVGEGQLITEDNVELVLEL